MLEFEDDNGNGESNWVLIRFAVALRKECVNRNVVYDDSVAKSRRSYIRRQIRTTNKFLNEELKYRLLIFFVRLECFIQQKKYPPAFRQKGKSHLLGKEITADSGCRYPSGKSRLRHERIGMHC